LLSILRRACLIIRGSWWRLLILILILWLAFLLTSFINILIVYIGQLSIILIIFSFILILTILIGIWYLILIIFITFSDHWVLVTIILNWSIILISSSYFFVISFDVLFLLSSWYCSLITIVSILIRIFDSSINIFFRLLSIITISIW